MIYVVFMRDINRWIDSMWFSESHARERAAAVKENAEKAFGVTLRAWVTPFRLEDGKLEVLEQAE